MRVSQLLEISDAFMNVQINDIATEDVLFTGSVEYAMDCDYETYEVVSLSIENNCLVICIDLSSENDI